MVNSIDNQVEDRMASDKIRRQTLVDALRAAGDTIKLPFKAENIKASKQAAIKAIEKHFPNDVIITEDMGADRLNLLGPAYINTFTGWVFGVLVNTEAEVSLGYVESGNSLIAGLYAPFYKELFFAQLGAGAFLNNQPIHVAANPRIMNSAHVGSSNSKDGLDNRKNLERFLHLNPIPHVVYRDHPPLAMVEVACGRLDLYHYSGLKPWDNVAGFLIAQEAGAKVVDPAGKPVNFISSRVVMGNPRIVDDFIRQTKVVAE